MLPNEEAAIAQLADQFKDHFGRMATQLELALLLLKGNIHIPKQPGLDQIVVVTVLALFSKATKTFRGLKQLCELGLGQDAAALLRVLLETSFVVRFILQKDGPYRVRRYIAHLHVKSHRDAVFQKPPQIRIAEKKQMLDELAKRLGQEPAALQEQLKTHWWPGATLKIAQELDWESVYHVVYRRLSDAAHALDALDHVEVTDRPELAQLGQAEAREFFSAVESLLAHAEPSTHLSDFLAAFNLVEGVDDVFVAAVFTGHRLRLLGRRRRPASEITDRSFFAFLLSEFRVLGQPAGLGLLMCR